MQFSELKPGDRFHFIYNNGEVEKKVHLVVRRRYVGDSPRGNEYGCECPDCQILEKPPTYALDLEKGLYVTSTFPTAKVQLVNHV